MAENENVNSMVEETTMDVTDKKCPNCGATVVYNPATLSMTCDFCGYSRALPKPEEGKAIEELDFASAKLRQGCDWGAVKKSLVCKNCGAESVYDSVDTAAVCPFCGSTSVMPVEGIEEVMAPGGVVPFEISNEKAAELFKSWIKGHMFAPTEAQKSCKADGFNGVYLPFWTYDSQTTSSYTAKLGFHEKRGDETITVWKTYNGVYDEFIDDQVVYGSNKTRNPFIKQLAVFDFKKLRPYDPQLVAGFAAERYSVGLDDGWTEAKKLIAQTLKSNLTEKLKNQYKADEVGTINMSTSHDKVTFKYILGPMWIASYKYKDKVYNFVVNGQTGKIAGDSPVSPWKVAIAVIITIAVIILLGYLFG